MMFHTFDLVTGEYRATCTGDAANNPGVRDDMTDVAPPGRLPGYALVWDRASQWNQVVDQRGTAYTDADGNELVWRQLGPAPASSAPGLLKAAQAKKWAEIKAARDAAIDAPLVTPYGTFDSDKTARDNIANTVQLLDKLFERGQPSDTSFGLADNTRVPLTRDQMGTVGLMLGAKVQGAYEKADQLRASIDAATTVEEVEAISWT